MRDQTQVRVEFRDSRMLQPRSGSCTDQVSMTSLNYLVLTIFKGVGT